MEARERAAYTASHEGELHKQCMVCTYGYTVFCMPFVSLRDYGGEIPRKFSTHKNYVLRSKVEPSKRVTHTASLEGELYI